eukprot:664513-Rhodomonas_salina.2
MGASEKGETRVWKSGTTEEIELHECMLALADAWDSVLVWGFGELPVVCWEEVGRRRMRLAGAGSWCSFRGVCDGTRGEALWVTERGKACDLGAENWRCCLVGV